MRPQPSIWNHLQPASPSSGLSLTDESNIKGCLPDFAEDRRYVEQHRPSFLPTSWVVLQPQTRALASAYLDRRGKANKQDSHARIHYSPDYKNISPVELSTNSA